MIRAGKFTDQKAIEGLIRRQHAGSKYLGRCAISDKALSELVVGLFASQTQPSVGASHVSVAVKDGRVVGFIAGMLQRVYLIGKRLEANDLFFINEGSPADAVALVEAYLAWARAHRMVLDIKLSWSDAMPGAERVALLFQRKGLTRSGEVYTVSTDTTREGEECRES